jgi:soluble lytic murein transglycosylase
LWLNGRNLQFLGKYEKALVPFDELAIKFAGSDESFEALLRMGLIQLRLKNYAAATAVFSRYLSSSDSAAKSKYELSVKYWRIRSMQLQKQENKVSQVDGIDVLIEELIREYPFSYYGLRLWSEQNQGALPDFAENKSLFKNPQAVAVWLVGEQKKAWSRFKILAQSGWWSEALSELSLIPQLQDTNYKLLLAYFLSSHHLYQPAIRLVNELMDENEVLRNKTVLQLGFPKVFIEDFQQQAAKYRLSPYLLRSLTRQESAYNVRAVSSSNALGLMQLIPPTAMDVARSLSLKSLKVPEDLFRPSINIAMGSFYINQMLQEFSYNVPMALAAYNAGPSRMKIWLDLRPEVKSQRDQASSMPMDEIWFDELPWNESSFYIKAILRNVMLYQALENHSIKLKPVLWQDLVEKKSDRGG